MQAPKSKFNSFYHTNTTISIILSLYYKQVNIYVLKYKFSSLYL